MRRTSKRGAYSTIKRSEGKRSGLEVQVASQLDALGVEYRYEKTSDVIEYQDTRSRKYKPDFVIPRPYPIPTYKIIIETKGWFKTEDRRKHLLIKSQRPDLDIRFVFSNPDQRISKQSKTTYAMWCEKNGFKYAKGEVPKEWLT